MTAKDKLNADNLMVQEHCIDLPGESVQCWIGGGTDKLKVILRKHRDVIFDIRLGNGKSYTLESTEGDFYSPRDKKLITASPNGKATFKDGERFHLWISRGFQGALILRLDGRIIYKIEPNRWDKQKYSDDPKEKPAPIIVAIGSDIKTLPPAKGTITRPLYSGPPQPRTPVLTIAAAKGGAAQTSDISCPVVCVVDGKTEGMPAHIVEHFKKGGNESGFADIDPNHIATRNWIWGQVAGTAAYIKDNWEWLRASLDEKTSQGFKIVKAQVHYVRGKVRFYFSGYSNSNTVFGRGGFGPNHERIMGIFAGAGTTTSTFRSILSGVAGTFQKTALVSFIFGTATAYAEWKDDIQKDGYDFAAVLITTIVKTILVAAITTLVVAAVVWLVMIAFGTAIPVIAVGALTIGVGFIATYLAEVADKFAGRAVTQNPSNADGTASIVAQYMREFGNSTVVRLQQNWNYLVYKMSRDYQEIAF